MKKITPISRILQGKRADIGNYKIDRIIPNRFIEAVGPVVFLDHLLPLIEINTKQEWMGAHPHRGIATLTYILNGEAEHLDSRGHHAKVHSGGVQWMKAGNGIVHDESIHADPTTDIALIHSFQFWINLPAKNKAEDPFYLPVEKTDVPLKVFPNNSGWIKVVAGDFEDMRSEIPAYSKQFIYHLHLEGRQLFSLRTEPTMEYAAYLPLQSLVVNDNEYYMGDLLVFEQREGEIEIKNISINPVDLIFFGGEKYMEPVVATGPFVMNTHHEISLAYNDYYEGKYGVIRYDK